MNEIAHLCGKSWNIISDQSEASISESHVSVLKGIVFLKKNILSSVAQLVTQQLLTHVI